MNIFNKIFNSINEELPDFKSLDEGIDFLMGYLSRFSEDLYDMDFYINKRWREVRDDLHFQEAVLHVFEEDGSYLRIFDGDIFTGSWEYTLGGLVIRFEGKHELYERVFLNESFFILKKHGDHTSKGNRSKYFFIATESLARRMEWIDLLTIMYDIYKSNTNYMMIVFGFFVLAAIIVLLSII